MSAFETTEATPTSPAPMAATPSAIGTVSAPNAEVAESVDLTDIAKTSWDGVPGSPKKTQNPPLRERVSLRDGRRRLSRQPRLQ